MSDNFDTERGRAVALLQGNNRRLRRRAVAEFLGGIMTFPLAYILGVIHAVAGVPRSEEATNIMLGLTAGGGLVLLLRAAIDWFGSLRRPAKAVTRSATTYTNPDDALAAAFQLDMHGDWDAANALYREVARRWPENEPYAHGRMRRSKRSSAMQTTVRMRDLRNVGRQSLRRERPTPRVGRRLRNGESGCSAALLAVQPFAPLR